MTEVISRLKDTPGCARIRTSFMPTNAVAESLYYGLGFRKTGEADEGEVVAALPVTEDDKKNAITGSSQQ
ncbi:MAG: hypothetical protein HN368_23225 [Spirochaetales bacterium]|nr:hypothetical protein [Spirochaetales bacterium]